MGDDSTACRVRPRSSDVVECAACCDEIRTREWHPVTTAVGDDESLRIVPFCDRDCREYWLSEIDGASTMENDDDGT